jgi:glutathione S-transferase
MAEAPSTPQNKTQEEFTLQTKAHDKRYEMSGQRLNFVSSLVPALLRAGNGAYVLEGVQQWKRPEKLIELWEFQASPYCRKVREACTLLDIDVLFYPCPKKGEVHRPQAKEVSPTGKLQFPLMRDQNTGKVLQESDDIVNYLFKEYGNGKVPISLKLGPLTTGSAIVGSLVRGLAGGYSKPNKQPAKPLDIWGYEASPFCLQVRELLTELEISHVYHNAARNSPKRPEFEAKWGVMQFPYIEDANTKIAMYETPEILAYLKQNYGTKS